MGTQNKIKIGYKGRRETRYWVAANSFLQRCNFHAFKYSFKMPLLYLDALQIRVLYLLVESVSKKPGSYISLCIDFFSLVSIQRGNIKSSKMEGQKKDEKRVMMLNLSCSAIAMITINLDSLLPPFPIRKTWGKNWNEEEVDKISFPISNIRYFRECWALLSF